MKEKIGIEKLVELLNEAKPLKKYKEYWYIGNEICLITYAKDYGASESRNITLDVISKSFGFIKWLVENDKIDLGEKLFNLTKNDNRKSMICDLDNNDFSWEDTFLMLLSISDTPIEDLLLYLK